MADQDYEVTLREGTIDQDGLERFSGVLRGDIGGSQPGAVIVKTYTAAQIAARFDSFDAPIELAEVTDGMYVWGIWESTNDLDNDCVCSGLLAYDPDAASADVTANGEGLTQLITSVVQGAYQSVATVPAVVAAATIKLSFLNTGKAAYVSYNASEAPTTGSSTVVIFVS